MKVEVRLKKHVETTFLCGDIVISNDHKTILIVTNEEGRYTDTFSALVLQDDINPIGSIDNLWSKPLFHKHNGTITISND